MRLFGSAVFLVGAEAVLQQGCPNPATAFLNSVSQNSKKNGDCTDWADKK